MVLRLIGLIYSMPKTRAQKDEQIAELAKAFTSGKSVMFVDYQGMTVPKVTALRKQLSGAKVGYMVAKKTLLGLAAKQAGFEVDFKSMPGMLGAAFATEDEMSAAKLIGDATKDSTIKLVGGIFEGKVIDAKYAITLSKLPSKSQLLGQLLSVLNGPSSAFVRALNARAEKMGVPATAPAAPAAEAPTEAPVEAPAAA